MSNIDTVQELSIPLSDLVPRMRSGTMWAHNTAIYLGPSSLEDFRLLQNGTWTDHWQLGSIFSNVGGIWTYDTAKPDAGWARLSYLGSASQPSLLTGGSVAYLDDIAYIMGGASNQTIIFKNPDGTLAMNPLALAMVREPGGMLDLLYKLDIRKKVVKNETTGSSIGRVSSGRMVSIKGVGKKGSK